MTPRNQELDLSDPSDPIEPSEEDLAQPAPPSRFHITDDRQAEWAMRKLAAVRHRHNEARHLAAEQIARYERWLAQQDVAYEREERFFEHLLSEYARGVRATSDGRRKSISLPHGVIQTRESKATFTVADADAALAWAKAHHPEAVKVQESVTKTTLSSAVVIDSGQPRDPDTGLPVPGLVYVEPAISVTVKTD